jgi:hypothetical protein
MGVSIDCASAARLVAEGAIWFDADTSAATCDGLPVRVPPSAAEELRPILVWGSSDHVARAAADRLGRRGLAAWQVIGGAPGRPPADQGGGPGASPPVPAGCQPDVLS